MARFDIYDNLGRNKASIPYLVEVQSNVISGLATRIVIPLRAVAGFSKFTLPADLFPVIAVNGTDYFVDTPQLGAIPSSELKVRIGSAKDYRFEIQAALDRVFGSY